MMNCVLATRFLLLVFSLSCAGPSVRGQTTFYVDDDCGDDAWSGLSQVCVSPDGPKQTIQAAIELSVGGDTVVVADGYYLLEDPLDLGGRTITLRSENGPSACTVGPLKYSQRENQLLRIIGRGSVPTEVQGFLFTGGRMPKLGAIGIQDANAHFTNCNFKQNGDSDHDTGAVYAENSALKFTDCSFSYNTASKAPAIWAISCDVELVRCSFEYNLAYEECGGTHGAVSLSGAQITVTDCDFLGNGTTQSSCMGMGFGDVGALGVYGGNIEILRCSFIGNSASGWPGDGGGGALRAKGARIRIEECVIDDNQSLGGGSDAVGVVEVTSQDCVISNCLFIGNRAEGWPNSLGTVLWHGTGKIVNCTFAGNQSHQGASIVHSGGAGTPLEVTNCVMWDYPQSAIDGVSPGSAVVIQNTTLYGGMAGVNVAPGYNVIWGPGISSLDPRFVDPSLNNLHLAPTSPCIDSGDNTALSLSVTTDLDGNPRFLDDLGMPNVGIPGNGHAEIVDRGAYEFQGTTCYADCDQSSGVGVLDIEDFLCFQAAFTNGQTYACDCDISTGVGNCDIFDFLCFQSHFVGGCP